MRSTSNLSREGGMEGGREGEGMEGGREEGSERVRQGGREERSL